MERLLDLRLCDGCENDTLGVRRLNPDFLRKVPGDRLALAVKVGREPDLAAGRHRVLGGLLEISHHCFFAGEHLIRRCELLFEIHARHGHLLALGRLARQVPHVPDTGKHDVLGAEILIDCFGLGRGFDDHEALAAGIALLVAQPLARTPTGRRLLPARLAGRGLLGRGLGGGLLR